MFFEKYTKKKDGVIRGYDVHSTPVKIACILIMIACFAIVLCCIFPIIWLFLASFKDIKEFNRNVTIFPAAFDFSRIAETWNAFNFLKYYRNSLFSVVGCVVCAVIFNGILAYVLAILKPKGNKIVSGLVMLSLLIPSSTSIISLFRNINVLNLGGSFIPIWLAAGANAFHIVMFKEFFEGIPKELLEAAKLDGCGVLKVFSAIVLPLSKPIIMVVAIFALTGAWSDFLLPYLTLNGTGKETVMVKLFAFKDTPTDAVSMLRACFFAIIPPTIIFSIFQKQITDGASAGAVKG
ncbi:MAG: carbohydrate ABC transporter permease [Lachnospiraceae bacterium]|nr:carbohydrate ABC transporter permease [Lachnospiraceae bacterium]